MSGCFDLTDPALLRELGVDDTALGSDEHGACQRVGSAAAWLGCDAILVPSARATEENLVILADQLEPDARIEVLEGEQVSD